MKKVVKMPELKRGLKAGAVVGLIWGFVAIIFEFMWNLIFNWIPNGSYIAYYLLGLVPQLAGTALIWGLFGLVFAAFYNKPTKKQSHKLAIFSSILAVLLIITHFAGLTDLALAPVVNLNNILVNLNSNSFVYVYVIQAPIFFCVIIVYSIIGTLLLNYFWDKFGQKEAKKKK